MKNERYYPYIFFIITAVFLCLFGLNIVTSILWTLWSVAVFVYIITDIIYTKWNKELKKREEDMAKIDSEAKDMVYEHLTEKKKDEEIDNYIKLVKNNKNGKN